jgi:hypothetical protein
VAGEIDPIVRRELKFLDSRGILGEDEIVCELQDVAMDIGAGALVLTHLRLLAINTTLIRRRTRLVSIPLERIDQVEAGPTKLGLGGLWKSHGSLTIRWRDESGTEATLELDRITGGPERAKEIARSITRQRDYLLPDRDRVRKEE